MSDIYKDREALRPEYEHFIQTEKGKEWEHFWQSQIGSDIGGDFGDYLYDFIQKCCSKQRIYVAIYIIGNTIWNRRKGQGREWI